MFPGQCFDCDSYACTGSCHTDTGSAPAFVTRVPPNSPRIVAGLEDSRKSVQLPLDSTGNSSSPSPAINDLQLSSESYVTATGSPVNLKRRNAMSGKKTPASKEHSSNSEGDYSREIIKQIGEKCYQALRQETLRTFPQTSTFGK